MVRVIWVELAGRVASPEREFEVERLLTVRCELVSGAAMMRPVLAGPVAVEGETVGRSMAWIRGPAGMGERVGIIEGADTGVCPYCPDEGFWETSFSRADFSEVIVCF